jgi:hypothetical protein
MQDNNMSQQFGVMDLVSLMSLVLGYQNLIENREQSDHNDVSSANDKQARYMLKELTSKFDEQNKMLRAIMDKLEVEYYEDDTENG